MSVAQITLLLAATAASFVSAQSPAEIAEYNVLVSDIKGHASDYLSVAVNDPSISIPSGVLQIYQQVATATDQSYTTLYQNLDFDQVSNLVVSLPWYSTRLAPEIASATATLGDSSSTEAASTEAASTESSSAESSPTTSAAPSSESAEPISTPVSQVTDGQIQATQTANGAGKAAVGMGAGALAAAVLLL